MDGWKGMEGWIIEWMRWRDGGGGGGGRCDVASVIMIF